jgi:hypothetical protein
MNATDFIWAAFWFFGGCFVFQVRGLKRVLDIISSLFSVLSIFTLLFKPDPITEIFFSISLGYFTGIFTLTIYLIGANISRYMQFNKMSSRIYLYMLSVPLWIILELKL